MGVCFTCEGVRDIKAILFDLDGTLLDIDMEFFLQKYFQKMLNLAGEFGLEKTDSLVQQIWRATEAMVMDKDPGRTNQQVFEEDFFRDYHHPPEVMKPFFDYFYTYGFSQLKDYCKCFPGVRSIVEKVFAKGYRVVIATNSLFPLSALEQRLDWAGVGDFPYELITSYEVMHFTKPHVEYYQEIADFMGLRPEECLMVGNDVSEDLSAGRLGMKTFLVKDQLINRNNAPITADWQGYLADLAEFIEQLP